jgi:hypothetical protein
MTQDKKLTELVELETSENGDLINVVDISAPTGTRSKKQTKQNLLKEVVLSISNIVTSLGNYFTKIESDSRYLQDETDPLSIHKDQTDPQTIINGIPLLEDTRNITQENELVDKKYVDSMTSGGMKSFFFTKTASDVGGMYIAQKELPTNTVQTITTTVSDPYTSPTVIATFITPVETQDYRVIEGSRFFYFRALTSNENRDVQLIGKIYTCGLDGSNPVLLRTSNWTPLLTETYTEYSVSVYGGSLLIDHTTTRIIFTVEAKKINNTNPDPTVSIQVDDDTFSRLDVPSPVGVTDISGLVPKTQNALTKEPTGFTSPEDVIINYDPTTQKITLTGTVVAYYQGTDISIANPTFVSGWVSTAHDDVTGHAYFLYYNGTNFLWADNAFPGFDMVLIATVNYGATNKWANRECHGFMPWQDHKEFHETIGTYKTAGGTFPSANYTLNSTTATNRRPTVDETTIYDEDVKTVLPALNTNAYSIYNLTNASVGTYTLDSTEIIPLSTNNPYYNSFTTPNWGQTLMPVNSAATVWIYAIPVISSSISQKYRYLFVQPQWITQATNSSAGALTTAVNTEALRSPSELNLGSLTLETPELVCIGKIIVAYTSSNWSLRAVTVLTGNKFSQIGSPSGNYLSTVVTDSTLTGNGTGGSPLSVVQNYYKTFQAGENLTAGDICYLKSDGKIWKAKGDTEATSKGMIVITTETKNTDEYCICLLKGDYTDTGLTTASLYYISISTAGAKTLTAPSASTNILRILGYATSTTNFYFDPDNTYVTIT